MCGCVTVILIFMHGHLYVHLYKIKHVSFIVCVTADRFWGIMLMLVCRHCQETGKQSKQKKTGPEYLPLNAVITLMGAAAAAV